MTGKIYSSPLTEDDIKELTIIDLKTYDYPLSLKEIKKINKSFKKKVKR